MGEHACGMLIEFMKDMTILFHGAGWTKSQVGEIRVVKWAG
jgi:hypothetical protein